MANTASILKTLSYNSVFTYAAQAPPRVESHSDGTTTSNSTSRNSSSLNSYPSIRANPEAARPPNAHDSAMGLGRLRGCRRQGLQQSGRKQRRRMTRFRIERLQLDGLGTLHHHAPQSARAPEQAPPLRRPRACPNPPPPRRPPQTTTRDTKPIRRSRPEAQPVSTFRGREIRRHLRPVSGRSPAASATNNATHGAHSFATAVGPPIACVAGGGGSRQR